MVCLLILSVCLLATTASFSKTTEPIDMTFGMWTRGAKQPCTDVLGGGAAWISREGTLYGGLARPDLLQSIILTLFARRQ